MSNINSVSYVQNTATNRGTPIKSAGSDMDKNSFLKILAAELTNQDPTNAADSTAYVTQMAQMVTMEQLTNLNNTMAFNANSSLIGKGVTVSDYDSQGKNYTGVVQAVTNQGSNTYVTLIVNENGKNVYKNFEASHVVSVIDVPDYAMDNLERYTSLLTSSMLIGKDIQLKVKENNEEKEYAGKVLEVGQANGSISLKVRVEATGETKSFYLDEITRIYESSQE